MPGRRELFAQLAVVLDDPVEDDRELAFVAAGQRVRVVLVHAAVRRPARVAEPGRRRSSRSGRPPLRGSAEVADGADVLEPVVLEQRDPGRVVAAELEPLAAPQKQRLRRPATDVSDDPAHARRLLSSCTPEPESLETAKARLQSSSPASGRSAELSRTSAAMVAQASRAASASSASTSTRIERLRAGRADEHAPRAAQSLVAAVRPRCEIAVGQLSSATGTFSFTCGKRGITAAASLSVRPRSAAQRSSPAARPSPVTWSRR